MLSRNGLDELIEKIEEEKRDISLYG